MVDVYGIKKPMRPSNVGFAVHLVSVLVFIESRSARRTKTLRKITTTRCRRLEEESLVLLWAQSYGDLAAQIVLVAIASDFGAIVLGHFMVKLCSLGHVRRYREGSWVAEAGRLKNTILDGQAAPLLFRPGLSLIWKGRNGRPSSYVLRR